MQLQLVLHKLNSSHNNKHNQLNKFQKLMIRKKIRKNQEEIYLAIFEQFKLKNN